MVRSTKGKRRDDNLEQSRRSQVATKVRSHSRTRRQSCKIIGVPQGGR
jgi:hypothetical protein